MKIGEENRQENGHLIGYALGYFNEYSLAGIYMDEIVRKTDIANGSYFEIWIETDHNDYNRVFQCSIREKILIDVFENQILADFFLYWLRLNINDDRIDLEYRKILEDWYLSDNAKFKVL